MLLTNINGHLTLINIFVQMSPDYFKQTNIYIYLYKVQGVSVSMSFYFLIKALTFQLHITIYI